MEKVYLVMGNDAIEFGHQTWVVKVFKDKQRAEKFCELQNQIEEYYSFYVQEEPISTQDMSAKVVPYYSYTFDTDFRMLFPDEEKQVKPENIKETLREINHPDSQFCNDEEYINRIYDEDLHIERNDYPTYKNITVYSVNSAKEAKEKALELWEEYYTQWEKAHNL